MQKLMWRKMFMIIHVRNFEKIESADIDISNFSIFVGENNSGKTYLMQLIYGLISCFFYDEEFKDFLGTSESLKIDIVNLKSDTETVCIKSDDNNFYTRFQNELNNFLNENKNKIIEKIFHTHNLSIEHLSIELGQLSVNYSIKCNNEYKMNPRTLKEEPVKRYAIIKNQIVIQKIGFAISMSEDFMEDIIKQEVLTNIMSEFIGGFEYYSIRPDVRSIIYLPASRSGIMLLYANYLANENRDNIIENESVIYENNDSGIENEYGLTEPIYNFLMFLLKHKDSEMIPESNKRILSFINNNIINGSLTKVGNTMRYKPSSSNQSIPIYLSSSLISELAPICQILSGIQRYSYILYDEIETCQHPTKQLQLARLLIRMVNAGYKMIVSTHSDTMAAAINNLITLSFKSNNKELAVKLGYTEEDLLQTPNVNAYQFIVENGKTKVVEIPNHFSVGVGFDFKLFNKANDKIYQDAVTIAEED